MIYSVDGHSIIIDRPSKDCHSRWSGEWSPEPETVAWIESLPREGVFFDIGANFGTFSVRAALHGLRVYSFEPTFVYYSELVKIVEQNDLSDLVSAYQLAISNRVGQGRMAQGRSEWTFYPGRGDTTSVTLDYITNSMEVQPDFIKLDVDGNELDVLRGATKTLQSVKSILIEVDPEVPEHRDIPQFMMDQGFDCDMWQVIDCLITKGKYAGTANWVFDRI